MVVLCETGLRIITFEFMVLSMLKYIGIGSILVYRRVTFVGDLTVHILL
jgi:hypothetical protein